MWNKCFSDWKCIVWMGYLDKNIDLATSKETVEKPKCFSIFKHYQVYGVQNECKLCSLVFSHFEVMLLFWDYLNMPFHLLSVGQAVYFQPVLVWLFIWFGSICHLMIIVGFQVTTAMSSLRLDHLVTFKFYVVHIYSLFLKLIVCDHFSKLYNGWTAFYSS